MRRFPHMGSKYPFQYNMSNMNPSKSLKRQTPKNLPQKLYNQRGIHDNYRTGHHKMGNARFG